MHKYIVTNCEYRLIEDNWKEGAGKTISVWNEDVEGSYTIEGVLKNVPHLDCDYDQNRKLVNNCLKGIFDGIFENDPVHSGDFSRFDGDLMVDLDFDSHTIIMPSKEKWEKFTKNEVNLYNLHITVYIRKVANLTKDDINEFWLSIN